MEVMALIPGRNCLWDDETIERYSMGTLPEGEAAALEEHLLVCESCRERLSREDALTGPIRRAAARYREQSLARERGNRVFPRLIPALAGLAFLFVAVLVAIEWTRPGHFLGPAVPVFAVRLEAMRGATPGATAPANRPLSIDADLSGLPASPSYRLELVDADGRGIWKGPAPHATLPPLRPGIYWMRVYSEGGALLREYGLTVQAPH